MKQVLMIAALLGVLAALGLGVTIASAQGPTPTPPVPGFGRLGGFGMMGVWNSDWFAKTQEAIAQVLGMTVDQLNAEYRAGKTLAQIAQAKNVSWEKVHDAMLEAHKTLLQQAVKDGKLTQAQADALLARMNAMEQSWDTNGAACPAYGWAPNPGWAPRGGMWGGTPPNIPPQNFRRPMMGGWR